MCIGNMCCIGMCIGNMRCIGMWIGVKVSFPIHLNCIGWKSASIIHRSWYCFYVATSCKAGKGVELLVLPCEDLHRILSRVSYVLN